MATDHQKCQKYRSPVAQPIDGMAGEGHEQVAKLACENTSGHVKEDRVHPRDHERSGPGFFSKTLGQ